MVLRTSRHREWNLPQVPLRPSKNTITDECNNLIVLHKFDAHKTTDVRLPRHCIRVVVHPLHIRTRTRNIEVRRSNNSGIDCRPYTRDVVGERHCTPVERVCCISNVYVDTITRGSEVDHTRRKRWIARHLNSNRINTSTWCHPERMCCAFKNALALHRPREKRRLHIFNACLWNAEAELAASGCLHNEFT